MSVLPPTDIPLTEADAERAFGDMLDGKPSEEEIARFLSELSDRGERAEIGADTGGVRDSMCVGAVFTR